MATNGFVKDGVLFTTETTHVQADGITYEITLHGMTFVNKVRPGRMEEGVRGDLTQQVLLTEQQQLQHQRMRKQAQELIKASSLQVRQDRQKQLVSSQHNPYQNSHQRVQDKITYPSFDSQKERNLAPAFTYDYLVPFMILEGELLQKVYSFWQERTVKLKPNEFISKQKKQFLKTNIVQFVFLEKMKLFADSFHEKYIFKLYDNNQQIEYACAFTPYNKMPLCFYWCASILLMRLLKFKNTFSQIGYQQKSNIHSQFYKNYFIQGYLHKKSQFLGKWERRYIIINKVGLYSFKDITDPEPSFVIYGSSIKYIWTRFEVELRDLIVKVKHGNSQTEFAIPIVNFLEAKNNWLYALYRLMLERFHPWGENCDQNL